MGTTCVGTHGRRKDFRKGITNADETCFVRICFNFQRSVYSSTCGYAIPFILACPKRGLKRLWLPAAIPYDLSSLISYQSPSDHRDRYSHTLRLAFMSPQLSFVASPAFFASDVSPARPPRFIVSTALLGTMTSAPFSLKPSKSMFIARKCNAVGLSEYCSAA